MHSLSKCKAPAYQCQYFTLFKPREEKMAFYTKQQTVNPWWRFWEDQNQRLKAMAGFRDDLGDVYNDTLNFTDTKGTNSELNFSVFDIEHIDAKDVALLTLQGETYPLSLKEYAKLAVATAVTPRSTQNAIKVYQLLLQLGGFFNISSSNLIDAENVEDFHISVLTQKVTHKGWHTRLSPPSYGALYGGGNLSKMRLKLSALGVTGVVSVGLSSKQWEVKLDSACKSAIGISLKEYKQGGSFNALTLEMGQYYVDHLRRVYEHDYLYTLVCQAALRNIPVYDGYQRGVLLETILGTFVPRSRDISKAQKVKSWNELHQEMASELYAQYVVYYDRVQSLKEDNICLLVQQLGLEMRFDAVEIIRVLMLQKYYDFNGGKTQESVWQGYLRSLDKSDLHAQQLKEISAKDVYAKMAKIIVKHKLTHEVFAKSLSKWAKVLLNGEKQTFQKLTGQFARVEDAMTSLIVAWLGYRKSEFGFPLEVIHVQPNFDVLDNAHVPFRFMLKWLVPKTNGKTKIDREITSQCYQVCSQLYDLFQPAEGEPCLYKNRGKMLYKLTSNESEAPIQNRVASNWEHFVQNYQPFLDIGELERLSAISIETLTPDEKVKFDSLNVLYDLSSMRVQHLIAANEEVKRDIVKLKCLPITGAENQKKFKKSLVEYFATGDITDPDHKLVVEKYLSDETKQWLKVNGDNLDVGAMGNISNELLSEVRYPTPHAFRHIWAESVLTRYQGDVGAVIRHQFCHLDDSFFMAYLRDKEVKGIVKAARMKVLNSVVDTLLIDLDRIGKEYLGGFARFVKKAASLTNTVTLDSVQALRDRIMGRVISINQSHFATCIPRTGGERRAKCADMGDINPQNARPSFCLGCTNAHITNGNLRGIWQTIQPFVKECLNDNVMGFMVQSHLPTLHSGYKRIKELRTEENAEQVDKIMLFIEKAINNVEHKLKAEESLYV